MDQIQTYNYQIIATKILTIIATFITILLNTVIQAKMVKLNFINSLWRDIKYSQ
jgi:hypothetical protein